ncbi:CASTOR/POLLUX-related putative ion channel [Sphaerisporangium fuscum]|uniref:CASTOR/POLLUX-related putative ion channel n=1 Tax=Sphaerisporangium fuscum TaxID=2835868 RepID=UPI0027E22A50|nr:potassium transporter TrkA [Sphaerisporangium fuscum]
MSRDRLRYWFDNTMSKGTPALIGWLAVASTALIVFVTLLATPFAAGKDAGALGWFEVAWQSLLHAMDTGTVAGDGGNWFFVFMMLVVTIGGLFIVSALVGVLTTGLEAKLEGLRKGRSRVVENGHTVILGWSDEIYSIIRELVTAKASEKRSIIAVLAPRDKIEMEEDLRARLGDTGTTLVVCRTGDPSEPSALDLVSPASAHAILVLPTEDSQLIKTLLALSHRDWPATRPPVVTAVSDSGNLAVARIAGGSHVEVVDSQDIAARLVVQSCRQSGLSAVYSDLLNFEGDEIYLRTEPGLVGRTYGEALTAYATATLLGVRRADGTAELNPATDGLIEEGDQVIVIARDDSEIRLATSAPAVHRDAIREPGAAERRPSRMLMLGSSRRRARILQELGHYLLPGSEIHLAGDQTKDFPAVPGMLVYARECDTTNRAALEALDVGGYDQVIVLSDDACDAQKADARTLITLLHLRDMRVAGAIVSEMNDERNRVLAEVAEADDFVVSSKLVSQLLTQVAENRHLAQVFDLLFSHRGPDIYLKPVEEYVTPGTINFATVIEAARLRGETALGYRLAGTSAVPPHYGVTLNPDKESPLTLTAQDRLIVLAES